MADSEEGIFINQTVRWEHCYNKTSSNVHNNITLRHVFVTDVLVEKQ